jgi:hypothetical protein
MTKKNTNNDGEVLTLYTRQNKTPSFNLDNFNLLLKDENKTISIMDLLTLLKHKSPLFKKLIKQKYKLEDKNEFTKTVDDYLAKND